MNKSPIRVMFVVPCLSMGGAERHLVTLLPNMESARFAPSVVCIGEEGGFFPVVEDADIDARALDLGRRRQAFLALARLIKEIRRARPDVVIVRGYSAEALGRIAAIIAGVTAIVVWVHNMEELRPRSLVRRMSDRLMQPRTTAYFGVAYAQLPYMRDVLGIPEEKIRIIHNGIDVAAFGGLPDPTVLSELGINAGDPVIGIVAGLRPEKDHRTFLRAAKVISSQVPSARFLIVGDGTLRAELKAVAKSLQIEQSVHFLGLRTDIGRLLSAMDVFTLCSRTVECLPFALLEAMASAVPAVCTDVGGIGEILDDGVSGYLVAPGDAEALAARIVSLLRDPQKARGMGNAARLRVQTDFTLRKSVIDAQEAIEEVVRAQRNSTTRRLSRRSLTAGAADARD